MPNSGYNQKYALAATGASHEEDWRDTELSGLRALCRSQQLAVELMEQEVSQLREAIFNQGELISSDYLTAELYQIYSEIRRNKGAVDERD